MPYGHNSLKYIKLNRPSQNVPRWHVDYFELKAIKTTGSRENCPSHSYLEQSKLGVFTRIRITTQDKFYLSDPTVCLLTSHVCGVPVYTKLNFVFSC